MGAPVGPAGTALSCNGDYDELDAPPRWRTSLSYSLSGTEIRFNDGSEGTLRRRAVSSALEFQVLEWMSLRASAGVALGGDLTFDETRYDIGVGPFGQLGASFTVLNGRDMLPFIVLGGTLSTSYGRTRLAGTDEERIDLLALDLRASAAIGKLFWNTLGPYLSARAFGGPIWWQRDGTDLTGSDRYHYQFGLGLLATSGRIDAFCEIAPFGERAATFGAAASF